jgi:hypothetical protein
MSCEYGSKQSEYRKMSVRIKVNEVRWIVFEAK